MPIAKFNKESLPQGFSTANGFFKIFRDSQTIKLINMTCPHRGGPLTHGEETTEYLICPWHKLKCKKISLEKMLLPVVTIGSAVLFIMDTKITNIFEKLPDRNYGEIKLC